MCNPHFEIRKICIFHCQINRFKLFSPVFFVKNKHPKSWLTKMRRDQRSLKDVKQNGIQTLRFFIFSMLKFSVKGACSHVGIKFCFFFEFVLMQGVIYELVAFCLWLNASGSAAAVLFPGSGWPKYFWKNNDRQKFVKISTKAVISGKWGVEIINRNSSGAWRHSWMQFEISSELEKKWEIQAPLGWFWILQNIL